MTPSRPSTPSGTTNATPSDGRVGLIMLALGLFFELIGVLNVRNVRRALKTGIVAGRYKSFGPATYDRNKNPVLYKLTFGGSLLAGIFALCFGLGCIGLAIFLLANS